jgi:hypothetical protein
VRWKEVIDIWLFLLYIHIVSKSIFEFFAFFCFCLVTASFPKQTSALNSNGKGQKIHMGIPSLRLLWIPSDPLLCPVHKSRRFAYTLLNIIHQLSTNVLMEVSYLKKRKDWKNGEIVGVGTMN